MEGNSRSFHEDCLNFGVVILLIFISVLAISIVKWCDDNDDPKKGVFCCFGLVFPKLEGLKHVRVEFPSKKFRRMTKADASRQNLMENHQNYYIYNHVNAVNIPIISS